MVHPLTRPSLTIKMEILHGPTLEIPRNMLQDLPRPIADLQDSGLEHLAERAGCGDGQFWTWGASRRVSDSLT